MKHTTIVAVAVTLAVAVTSSAVAQRSRLGARDGSGPLIDPATVVVVEGVVEQFAASAGQGMPELVVRGNDGELHTFILGPHWYLREQGFAAAPGDTVVVTAYGCLACDTGVAVVSIVNTTTGVTVTLRNEDGSPLWAQRQSRSGNGSGTGNGQGNGGGGQGNGNGQGNGQGNGGSGGQGNGQGSASCPYDRLVPDLGRTTTFVGTVETSSLQGGEGPALLVLATADGNVEIVLSPASVLVRAGFEPAEGDTLTVVAAPVAVNGGEVWLALTVTDQATGVQFVLRDPATGLPAVGHRRGRA